MFIRFIKNSHNKYKLRKVLKPAIELTVSRKRLPPAEVNNKSDKIAIAILITNKTDTKTKVPEPKQ